MSGSSHDGPAGDPGEAASLRGATPYDLWLWRQETAQRLEDLCARLLDAGTAEGCRAAAPEFLRLTRRFLTLRLTGVAADRRQAFEQRVPPAGGLAVAALWAEVFWAARAAAPEDGSGVLEEADAAIRGLLGLSPADLAGPEAVRTWWARLQQVEETLAGLEVQAQAALEARREAYEDALEVRRSGTS
ncbi:hypothetical protein SAMN05660690_3952 [Geodermatophilus telluris]|uniref:Uncharacterized protein n=1 Tax=Geodermatophilus telluris TaxID=1190417 RepID=A0A1G6TNH5_9ACTN|nr:hypothetical protein [Geodermatophilus telluris]SDD30601.1 hypothetical protein SAMN05660690_3952 [Geodermatophilus telluris]